MNDPKFRLAMLAYAALAIIAVFTLEGTPRLAAWIALGGIALKTWIEILRRRMD